MNLKKAGLLLIIFTVVILAHKFDVSSYLTLESIKENQSSIKAFYSANRLLFIALYMLLYIAVTTLSIPGAAVMTLAGGAIMGPWTGTAVIVISATLGATSALLVSRFIIRDSIENKYASIIEKFNKGIQKNALNYILFLRLVPAFPFFLINIGLGLTRIPIPTFIIGSVIGMTPGTFVFANAGSQLSQINSLGDIASPGVLGAFTLLGLIALIPVVYRSTNRFKCQRKKN